MKFKVGFSHIPQVMKTRDLIPKFPLWNSCRLSINLRAARAYKRKGSFVRFPWLLYRGEKRKWTLEAHFSLSWGSSFLLKKDVLNHWTHLSCLKSVHFLSKRLNNGDLKSRFQKFWVTLAGPEKKFFSALQGCFEMHIFLDASFISRDF